MKTIHDYKEERMRILHMQRSLLDKAKSESRALTQEESDQFDKSETDLNQITRTIDALEKDEQRAKEWAEERAKKGDSGFEDKKEKRAGTEVLDLFLRGLLLNDTSAIEEYRSYMKSEVRGTDTQIISSPSLGGYLVPQFWWNEIIQAMKYFGPMVNSDVVSIINTTNGSKWNIPTSDQTLVKGARISENTGNIVSDITFGTKALDAYKYTSREISVSQEMLEDSAYPLAPFIGNVIAERIGRILNEELTTGDNDAKPSGIVTASTMGKVASATNAFTINEILDLVHSVDIAYRPQAQFMMNDATVLALKKASVGASDDRPLWQPSIRDGQPETIAGYRFVINNDMASVSSGVNSRIMLFGDFKKYWVRFVNGLRINNDYKINTDAHVYAGYLRADGELLDTAAVKHLRLAAS
jgi:HK97 family phage major capsid protein